jgi:hypothetical protein
MVLVIASALLVRSSSTIQRGTHFDPGHVIVIRLRPELLKYTPRQIESLLKAVDQRLTLTPGIQSVAFMEGARGWSGIGGVAAMYTSAFLGRPLRKMPFLWFLNRM